MYKVRWLMGLSLALACGVAACEGETGDATGSDEYLNRSDEGDDDGRHRSLDGGISIVDGGRSRGGYRGLDGGRGRDRDDDSDEASEEEGADKPDGGRRCRFPRGRGHFGGERGRPHFPGRGDRDEANDERDDEREDERGPGPRDPRGPRGPVLDGDRNHVDAGH